MHYWCAYSIKQLIGKCPEVWAFLLSVLKNLFYESGRHENRSDLVDLNCVEWDVKPCSTINQRMTDRTTNWLVHCWIDWLVAVLLRSTWRRVVCAEPASEPGVPRDSTNHCHYNAHHCHLHYSVPGRLNHATHEGALLVSHPKRWLEHFIQVTV